MAATAPVYKRLAKRMRLLLMGSLAVPPFAFLAKASLDGTKRSVETNERSSTAVYRDWTSIEEPKLKRTHTHYQSQRSKEVHEHHHRPHGRRLSFQEAKMVTQDVKVGEEVVTGDEPPPPPQPPYHLPSRQIDETRGVRTDRERRSSRKLTKDSGYETSQYAESDYANVDWDQASDRSPTSKSNRSPSSDWGNASDHEFAASPPPPAYHDRSHGRTPDAWRGVYTRTNSSKSNYQTTGVQSTWDPVSSWGRKEVTSSVRAVPVHYSSHRTASAVRRSVPAESIGRYSSTDSLASGSSSCVSFPPAVSGAKSTPSLHVNSEDVAQRSYRSRASSASHMSNSTPNLEKDEAKVTRRTPKIYDPQPCGVYPASGRTRHQWIEEDPEGMKNMGPYQHSRQVSSQSSSGSERTSSSYSQHSRQVSSQSSFSEEDFRIQRIKEEFHQCMTYVQDYFPPPPPPYPMRYYSSEGLIYSQEVARWEQRLNPPVDNDVDSGKGSASPPPPPVRDASSLKYSSRRPTTSGHEKFSSWPVDGENSNPNKYDPYYYNKKERPPSYDDGPPPPYSPYWTRSEPQEDHEAVNDTTATPLMDRLRQDAQQTSWNGKEETAAHNYNGRDSVTSSTSSQETLKWHGSTSDLSVQSERTRSATTGAVVPVTVHSARVKPPQRHHSESVLYYGNPENEVPVRCVPIDHPNSSWAEQVRKNNATNVATTGKRLLPPPHANSFASPRSQAVANEEIRTLLSPEFAKPLMSVAQRIQDLERLQARANTNSFKKNLSGHEEEGSDRALYLDPAKKHRVSDPELKAIQKQAVRSFFERQTGVSSQRRHSSSARSSQSLPRNCLPVEEKSGLGRGHRVVDVKVAIYYNTYTQTLVSGDEVNMARERRVSGGHFASTPSPPTLRERDDGVRPRRDIALQTEWIAPARSPCKDQNSITKDGEAKNRENSTSCRPDAKNARPPERPPKRPHLNRSTPREETPPPPPLLPRAGASLASARAALVIPNDEDVEDQELLSIEESARQLRNLEPPPTAGVQRPPPPCLEGEREGDLSRGSTPELPLPPPPVRTDEVVVNDEPLPPPPTPNEVKKIFQSSISEGIDEPVSPSLIYPKDSYMSYRSERQPGRLGFDGNYHRTSPEMINSDIENNQLPNLSPTGTLTWEKKHNIGLRGPTVVYKSTDTKSATAPKPYTRTEEHTNGTQNEHRGKLSSLNSRMNGDTHFRSSIASSTTSSTISSLDGPESPPPSLASTQGHLEEDKAPEEQKSQQEMTTQTTPSINKVGQTWRQQEAECELLSKDLARQLPEEEKALQALLVPCQLKTTADYMQGLFEVSTASRRSANRARLNPGSSPPFAADVAKRSLQKAVLPADSAYYTTSESKARFLTRYSKDVKQAKMDDDTMDVGKKKEDLVTSIGRKLEILRTEQLIIHEEISANQELGRSVTNRVEKLAKSNEYEKFKLHVEEIDKITSLLLGLSGRLARAENALMDLADESSKEDREVIKAKRDKLYEQHEEAKRLKENIDRRSLQVSNFLHNYLSSDEYADYDHFIKMKSKLLIDSREIDDKIKLGEEQMMALTNNLGNSPL
uniref:ASD2 domain-containing protein n=1 Tax=Strigamia maritima TaxID=126957 RepID=T1IQV0_STRMM